MLEPLLAAVGDVGGTIADAPGVLQYLLVAVFAAIPWIEIAVVIPIAIGLGLDPLVVGGAAFVGNVATVLLLLAFHERLSRWWSRRRGGSDDDDADESRRKRWARRVWKRYGLPGLALASPVLTGVHLAALIALAVGSKRRRVANWMTIGLAAWTVVLVAGSVLGLSLLGIG